MVLYDWRDVYVVEHMRDEQEGIITGRDDVCGLFPAVLQNPGWLGHPAESVQDLSDGWLSCRG